MSFLVGLLKKQRALVYMVAQSSSRAIYFPEKDTYAPFNLQLFARRRRGARDAGGSPEPRRGAEDARQKRQVLFACCCSGDEIWHGRINSSCKERPLQDRLQNVAFEAPNG